MITGWSNLSRAYSTALTGIDATCPQLLPREPCLMPAWKRDWDLRALKCFDFRRLPVAVRKQLRDPIGSQCF